MQALKWLTILAAAALVALMLHLGDPERPDWWPPALLFFLWAGAPVVIPWLAVRRRPALVLPALIAFVAASGSAAVAYWQAFARSTSSTSALALLFVPLWQWAILLVTGVASAGLARLLRRTPR